MKSKLFTSLTALVFTGFVGATQIQAQPVAFNPNDPAINNTGKNASIISIAGTIPEFIQFTAIDDTLEMGDMGGPKATGFQKSFGTPRNPHSGSGLVGLSNTENGLASAEFGNNTFVRVTTTVTRLRNNGPDTIRNNADDVILPTTVSRSVFGPNVQRGPATVPNTAAQQNIDINGTGGVISSDGIGFLELRFGPAPSNGFTFAGTVTRSGLNDYKGSYTSVINLKYYKY